jgi:hypothetical protein
MIDFFPAYADLHTAAKARITFRHLLTMSPGLAWTEAVAWKSPKNSERQLFEAKDPFRYALKQRVVSPPGIVFNYSGGATTLLGGALAKATGARIDDYARDRLFAPLGIDFEWLGFAGSAEIAAFVVPELDLVVAINAAHYNSRLQGLTATAILNRFVLPAIKDRRVSSAC